MTHRIRNLSLAALLILAVAAFVYFGLVRKQARRNPSPNQVAQASVEYYCPMHPTHRSDKPGNCPVCSMKLVKLEAAPALETAAPVTAPSSTTQDNAVFVAPEKQQLIGMRSVAAEAGVLTKEIRIAGKVSYDETRVTHIHSKVSGYIEEVFANSVGKPVRAGEPLFTIYSPDLVATEQEYLLAIKSRDVLKASTVDSAVRGSENLIAAARERLRLWDVSEQEIQSLENEGKVKRAITVYSPVSGVVTERAAYHHGTFVDPSKDLFTIVDLSHVWVLGEVYEADLPFVRPGQSVEIELPYSGSRKIRGRVSFIYPFLDPKTRTVQVRMEFPNSDLSLKPEMFTNINMAISMGRQVLVPGDAVMNTGIEQYVFVDIGNGYLQPRKVKVSAEAGERAGIQEGLKAGEKVVTGANFIVDSESRLKGALAGMGAPSPAPAGAAPAAGAAIAVDVLEPKTAKTGMNPIRLLLKDASGNSITGAQVDVELFMPQMGAMPPMTSKARLSESGGGVYSGQIEFQMAWTWQTTVTVRKDGGVIGVARTSITSR
jgi:membrane fusion protein, copper/silver efflux system